MDSTGYTTLTRQVGLSTEMQKIANNIANMSTTGYRRDGVVFSEFVAALGAGEESLSMAVGDGRITALTQGALTQTGNKFDLAIEGDGFFLLETAQGQMLTRAGAFSPSEIGEIVAADGARLLDLGGAPILVPFDAERVAVATDGTVSADGEPLAQIGLYRPVDANELTREAGVRFSAQSGFEGVEDGTIHQGFVESSNVDPVVEIARMIEVQRAYEMGQGLMETEDQRIRSVLQTLGGA
ncbi:MAG: flagellar hook-basal body complex protein [Pseudomonadota bacterium]